RMKLDLARELIAGTWYITADYNGKKTRFQLVPIEELNELRQKVGLPVSRFTYGKGGSTEERDGDGKTGEESGISCPKKARSAEPEHFDLPDDGLVPDTVDEDMPF
ncbi:MAG: hypothetical protein K6E75_03285, partial [Lachnospiraceae bacterium]|nr:hypothetical protein [Lachnospiraceae bacterium]